MLGLERGTYLPNRLSGDQCELTKEGFSCRCGRLHGVQGMQVYQSDVA
jgi:hypothetical protein